MRKIFFSLSALILSVVTSLPIIACHNQFNDPNVYRITVVTDGHTINDHSFNESSYKAALQFKKEFDVWSHNTTDALYKNKTVEVSWDNPQLTTLENLMTSYNKAVFINSKVIIASGFLHHDALVKSQNGVLKHQTKFVFVDGDTPNSEVPKSNKQLAGLLYKTEQSGFLAGIAGATWLVANHEDYDSNDLKMSTYGGIDIPAVTNYMYGYYWAIQLFNDKTNISLQNKFLNWIKVLNPQFNLPTIPKINFVSLGNQFSGNFTQGSESSRAINDSLVSQGTNIIFPVAGPQTEDTLSALKSGNGKIIGVDTNQQAQYPQSFERFITSAEKDIVNSVDFMLWKAIGRTNVGPNHDVDPKASDTFIDDAIYRGGIGFTAIADNKAIKNGTKDIYTPLTTDSDILALLNKVSNGWEKILVLKKNFWVNGIKATANPF